MSWRSFLFFCFFPITVTAGPLQFPENCLQQGLRPCSLWATKSMDVMMPGAQVLLGKGSLLTLQKGGVRLHKGKAWVRTTGEIQVQHTYGDLVLPAESEAWLEAGRTELLVRSFKKPILIKPLGLASGYPLKRGWQSSLMSLQGGAPGWSVPESILLVNHLKSFSQVLKDPEVLKEKSQYYAATILNASRASAQFYQKVYSRGLASVTHKPGLLEEERARSLKDSFLRDLFRRKNNFVE